MFFALVIYLAYRMFVYYCNCGDEVALAAIIVISYKYRNIGNFRSIVNISITFIDKSSIFIPRLET